MHVPIRRTNEPSGDPNPNFLLRPPPELRNQIYRYVLSGHHIEIRATANNVNDRDVACVRATRDGMREQCPNIELSAVLLKRVTPYILAPRPARYVGDKVEYVEIDEDSDEDSDEQSDE